MPLVGRSDQATKGGSRYNITKFSAVFAGVEGDIKGRYGVQFRNDYIDVEPLEFVEAQVLDNGKLPEYIKQNSGDNSIQILQLRNWEEFAKKNGWKDDGVASVRDWLEESQRRIVFQLVEHQFLDDNGKPSVDEDGNELSPGKFYGIASFEKGADTDTSDDEPEDESEDEVPEIPDLLSAKIVKVVADGASTRELIRRNALDRPKGKEFEKAYPGGLKAMLDKLVEDGLLTVAKGKFGLPTADDEPESSANADDF